MKKTIKTTTILISLMLIAAFLMIPAAAMGFTVTPELPETQRENGSSFFDLIVAPGLQQDITLIVSNTGDDDIVVQVELITTSTNRNGQINYTSKGVPDSTLEFSFEDIASVSQTHYEIPAREEVIISVTVAVPNEYFEGALLGSIRILREATDREREDPDTNVDQYTHVTAVVLVMRDDAEEILDPDFALGSITIEPAGNSSLVTANVRNIKPILVIGATVTAKIFPAGGDQPIFENTMDSVDFAPNSIFPFSFTDREDFYIDPGNYTAVVTLQYQDMTWEFEENFAIAPDEADEVNEVDESNEGADNQNVLQEDEEKSTPIWIIIAISFGGVILIIVIVMIIVTAKSSRKGLPPSVKSK